MGLIEGFLAVLIVALAAVAIGSLLLLVFDTK